MVTEENIKSVALEFFQNSKTFCQNSSVKSKIVDTALNIARSAGQKAGQKLLILRVRN